jgi:hypothetical protein
MQFEDFADIDPELHERLSSWRQVSGVVEHSPDSMGESGFNEVQVRARQRRVASMILNSVKGHDAFVADLKALVENQHQQRDLHHQSRVEDYAAFALGVYEQTSDYFWKKAFTTRQLTSPVRSCKPSMFRPRRRQSRGFSGCCWAANP